METVEKTSTDANSREGEDKQPDQSAGRPLTTPPCKESTESDSHTKEKDELVKTETVGMEPKVTYSNMTACSLLDPESLEEFILQPAPGTGRTKTPDSSRPKSSSSGEIMFEAKRRRRKVASGPNAHTVTFTVNIAMAIPTVKDKSGRSHRQGTPVQPRVEDDCQPDIKEMLKKKKRVFEAPRAQNYYHIEYYLLPDEEELTKTDIVTYGMAAKIYMERHDPRVIKTWHDGDVTWVAWANTHIVTVTTDVLLKMFNHKLELRVWDTKDKVSTRARFDRPKAFRLPQAKAGEDLDEIGGVKASVLKQSGSFACLQPKKGGAVRPLPVTITFPKLDRGAKRKGRFRGGDSDDFDDDKMMSDTGQRDLDNKGESPRCPPQPEEAAPNPSPNTLIAVANRDHGGQDVRTFSRLGKLAGAESPTQSPNKELRISQQSAEKLPTGKSRSPTHSSKSKKNQGQHSPQARAQSAPRCGEMDGKSTGSPQHPRDRESTVKKRSKKAEAAVAEAAENIKKFGICVVPIRMSLLFAGMKSLTGRLQKAVPGIEDVFISVALDSALMTDKQKADLNPMIIKIQSATNLPETPMSYQELQTRCKPVYCKYQFFKQPVHVTLGKEHARNIYWDDISVALLGTMEQSELREYLNGPALEIQVHDRDRKEENVKLKPTLFGDDLEDEKISSVGTVTSRRTLHNPFQGRNKPWDPSGLAQVDLSELLLGHRYLHLKLPIQNAAIPDMLGSETRPDGRVIGIAGAVDGPVDRPLSTGHYQNASATLKVKIELAFPLTTPSRVSAKEPLLSTNECPFGRIVFLFDYKNVMMLHKLQSLITSINAHALELDDMPQHVINAALSTYKLSAEQQESRELDIITGFQVLDGNMHLFVLEGLRDKAVHVLWEALPQPHDSDVTVLFNSDMLFSSRLYGPLDVDLCRVKLHEPLSIITQQSLLYVRDMVPKPCFQALVKLEQLCRLKKFRDAIRNSLFPTADMVISMSREFGVPFTSEDFQELQPEVEKEAVTIEERPSAPRPFTSREWTPIDNFNLEYVAGIADRDGQRQHHNYLKENMDDVQEQSIKNKLERDRNRPQTIKADVTTAHNYSSQTLNSTELGREKLRKSLASNPDTRHTYCQDYHHSMTVVPVNTEALQKEAEDKAKAQWRTESGFVYPGMKSMQDSNIHPKRPDEARSQELHGPWRENLLHVNILQPPLSRDNYPWDYRRVDLELYRRPPPRFGNEPVTIHLAGEKLRQEKLAAKNQDLSSWRSKIVVDDIRHYAHRCLPETEMKGLGFYSSNQVDRLRGLLKDSPAKFTLRRPGLALNEIPPLSVVLNPSVDTDARAAGLPIYPAVRGEGMESTRGFKPGPFEGRRWQLEKNKIPVFDYEHQRIARLKGQDFNVYHTNRNNLWKREINPLSADDRDNHLFRIPDDPDVWGPVDNTGFDLQRSYTQPIISHTAGMTLSSQSPDLIHHTKVKKQMEVIAS
ncbi:uncharacterized protein LOC124146111 isoform X2 [Haliotis rufescens]|uniref:uncharacterized protein LOC124146111 isoform X2 n=1 Tax=Haliotis rufescens TaxID=6454 RepID=UPI00201F573B|nr:uncharacterized protein LOC124146111 isoform X2 [Haliotis rufescens]